MVASAGFKPLVAVLQGLRPHDERLVEQLASRARTHGQHKVHVRRDEDGSSAPAVSRTARTGSSTTPRPPKQTTSASSRLKALKDSSARELVGSGEERCGTEVRLQPDDRRGGIGKFVGHRTVSSSGTGLLAVPCAEQPVAAVLRAGSARSRTVSPGASMTTMWPCRLVPVPAAGRRRGRRETSCAAWRLRLWAPRAPAAVQVGAAGPGGNLGRLGSPCAGAGGVRRRRYAPCRSAPQRKALVLPRRAETSD
ncbi:hypothetical protein QFZ64_000443 [Streptomyces sp. B3I8]|nr:hypothetical protein [Streptomyces sp. B3I8]